MPIANYTTGKAVDETMADLIVSLRRRGVTRISTVYDTDDNPVGLEFTMQTDWGARDFALPIRVEGVQQALVRAEAAGEFASLRKKAGTFTTPEHAARVAWAIARDWLRAQAALIDANLVTLDEVMFPWMLGFGNSAEPERTAFEAYRSQQKAIGS
jgi:hypothetical protein